MFSNRDKLIASSICHIFETGKPLGAPNTVAVLADRAGISYGIPQATDKSGNLDDVIERYIASKEEVLYEPYLIDLLLKLRNKTQRAIDARGRDKELKRILKECGNTEAMRKAQLANVDSRMNKAIRICLGSAFTTTMSLAVIYDSLNHGSFEKIRDKVKLDRSKFSNNLEFEKAWITSYVNNRDSWLENHSRQVLRNTDYRTDFFKKEISKNNWNLELPLNVHGFALNISHIATAEKEYETKTTTEQTVTKTTNSEQSNGQEVEKTETVLTNTNVVETLTQEAPPKENSVSESTKVTFAGFGIPTFLVTIWGIFQTAMSQGYISASQVGEIVINTIRENQKYFMILIGLIILLIIIKKVFKQVTMLFSMLTKAIPTWNNVEIVPNKSDTKGGDENV